MFGFELSAYLFEAESGQTVSSSLFLIPRIDTYWCTFIVEIILPRKAPCREKILTEDQEQ